MNEMPISTESTNRPLFRAGERALSSRHFVSPASRVGAERTRPRGNSSLTIPQAVQRPRALRGYEILIVGRGQAENHIKSWEDAFGRRTGTSWNTKATTHNQLRCCSCTPGSYWSMWGVSRVSECRNVRCGASPSSTTLRPAPHQDRRARRRDEDDVARLIIADIGLSRSEYPALRAGTYTATCHLSRGR